MKKVIMLVLVAISFVFTANFAQAQNLTPLAIRADFGN